jgi:hypothetical protein
VTAPGLPETRSEDTGPARRCSSLPSGTEAESCDGVGSPSAPRSPTARFASDAPGGHNGASCPTR